MNKKYSLYNIVFIYVLRLFIWILPKGPAEAAVYTIKINMNSPQKKELYFIDAMRESCIYINTVEKWKIKYLSRKTAGYNVMHKIRIIQRIFQKCLNFFFVFLSLKFILSWLCIYWKWWNNKKNEIVFLLLIGLFELKILMLS